MKRTWLALTLSTKNTACLNKWTPNKLRWIGFSRFFPMRSKKRALWYCCAMYLLAFSLKFEIEIYHRDNRDRLGIPRRKLRRECVYEMILMTIYSKFLVLLESRFTFLRFHPRHASVLDCCFRRVSGNWPGLVVEREPGIFKETNSWKRWKKLIFAMLRLLIFTNTVHHTVHIIIFNLRGQKCRSPRKYQGRSEEKAPRMHFTTRFAQVGLENSWNILGSMSWHRGR